MYINKAIRRKNSSSFKEYPLEKNKSRIEKSNEITENKHESICRTLCIFAWLKVLMRCIRKKTSSSVITKGIVITNQNMISMLLPQCSSSGLWTIKSVVDIIVIQITKTNPTNFILRDILYSL
jgi:hypothetical protein